MAGRCNAVAQRLAQVGQEVWDVPYAAMSLLMSSCASELGIPVSEAVAALMAGCCPAVAQQPALAGAEVGGVPVRHLPQRVLGRAGTPVL